MKSDRKKTKTPREPHAPVRSKADDPEPSAVRGGLPVWLFVLLSIMLFWAMVYLDNHAGGFSRVVYRPFTSSNELVQLVPFDPVKDKLTKGKAVYNMPTCMPCHQPHGMGTPPTFPPLAGAEWVLESDPARLIRITLDGLTGPIQVLGQTYVGTMPGWRPNLDDEQIAQVLTYIRNEWGNNAPEVMPEQVAQIRQETAGRDRPWTSDELLQIAVR